MNTYLLEGALSVKAVLEVDARPRYRLLLAEDLDSPDVNYMLALAKQKNVPVQRLERARIDELAFKSTHGGVLMDVGDRISQSLDALDPLKHRRLLWIEGVEDPYNLGQMMRSAYLAGFDGVILAPRDWSKNTSIVLKSSAGTFERLALFEGTREADVNALKAQGYALWVSHRGAGAKDYRRVDYPEQLILCVGGERRGLSRALLNAADETVHIPYPRAGRVALGAVSACALLVFEATRNQGQL
jgi:23S rRNA (guanosine2251-2'-O)-methyltransferase